jgi:hypothetical protein
MEPTAYGEENPVNKPKVVVLLLVEIKNPQNGGF